MNTILNVENIVKTYGKKINIKRALNHIQWEALWKVRKNMSRQAMIELIVF